MIDAELSREEFCRRFAYLMVKRGGETFSDGSSVRLYALEVAPRYWDEQHQDGESVEECVEIDMSCWGSERGRGTGTVSPSGNGQPRKIWLAALIVVVALCVVVLSLH